MDPKQALNEVVHVLEEIKHDPTHADEHGQALAHAVDHLRDADVEVPDTLANLAESLTKTQAEAHARDEQIEDGFDNLPV